MVRRIRVTLGALLLFALMPAWGSAQTTPDAAVVDQMSAELERPIAEFDIDFFRALYARPDAAKIVGQLVARPGFGEKNMRLGAIRAEMDRQVWESILRRRGIPIEYTNQGADNGARSDFDYTLYATKAGVPLETLIEEHRQGWIDLHGMDPERVEIAVMNGDHFYPDWRNERLSSAQYRAQVGQVAAELRQNPEAYFVVGANRQQVHNRALREGRTTVMRYDAVKDEVIYIEGDAADVAARYADVQPHYGNQNSFGNIVQNFLEFVRHPGDDAQTVIRRAKYFMRVINEGLGNTRLFANSYGDIARAAEQGMSLSRSEELKLEYLRQAFGVSESSAQRGSGDLLDLNDRQLYEVMAVIDLADRIHQDKVQDRQSYDAGRESYYLSTHSDDTPAIRDLKQSLSQRATESVNARSDAGNLSPEAHQRAVLNEAERLFSAEKARILVLSTLAGLEQGILNDMTRAGAIKAAVSYETDGQGRVIAVMRRDRVENTAFDRATEIAMLFEMVNTYGLDDTKAQLLGHLEGVLAKADPETRQVLRQYIDEVANITTGQLDNFLDAQSRRGRAGSSLNRSVDAVIQQKLQHVQAHGIDLVPNDRVGEYLANESFHRNLMSVQRQRMGPALEAPLRTAWDDIRLTARHEIGQAFTEKATGLMMTSSALNLVRAYQVGGTDALPWAVFTESLNYTPDIVELPVSALIALWQAASPEPDLTGLWSLYRAGFISFVPGLGHIMLLYDISNTSVSIVHTFFATRLDDDLLEQAFKSRRISADGTPITGDNVRARRNPYRDRLVRGSAPRYPILNQIIPFVDADTLSDRALAKQALRWFGSKIIEELETEGLDMGTDAWRDRARELTYEWGFDIPYMVRTSQVHEVLGPEVWGQTPEEEARKLTGVCTRVVRDWYTQQPEGYKLELQGTIATAGAQQEAQMLSRFIGYCEGLYRQAQENADAQADRDREIREGVVNGTDQLANLEHRLAATRVRSTQNMAEAMRYLAASIGEDALAQVDEGYSPTVEIEYPFAFATQELLPNIQIRTRALETQHAHPLETEVEHSLGDVVEGAPSGWTPGPEWEERFTPDASGHVAWVPVTVTHRFVAKVTDANGVAVGTAEREIPVVHYAANPKFAGSVAVRVMGEAEDGTQFEYVDAVVRLGSEERTTSLTGTASFGGLDEGTYTVEVDPREGDERHQPNSGTAEVVNVRLSGGTGEANPTITVVLSYLAEPQTPAQPNPDVPPPPTRDPPPGGGTGTGGNTGGTGQPPGGNPPPSVPPEPPPGPTPEEVASQIQGLASSLEAEREEARAACDFTAAAAAHAGVARVAEDFIARTFPTGAPPQVRSILDRINIELEALNRAARAEQDAQTWLRQAQGEIRARDVEDALTSLESAMAVENLPACLATQVRSLYDRLAEDVRRAANRTELVEEAANARCDYQEAERIGLEVQADLPNLSWVQLVLPEVQELAARQRDARSLRSQAEALAASGDLSGAATLAAEALRRAPNCDKPRYQPLADELARRQAASTQPTPTGPDPIKRSLVLLIDASGSMGQMSRLTDAKTAAANAIQYLGSGVEAAVIKYAGGACTGFDVLQDFTQDKSALLSAVASISSGGSTPTAPAIGFAHDYLRRNGRGASGQILLLTDGQNSCSDAGGMRGAGERLRQSSIPVRLDAVGFHLDNSAEMDLGEAVSASGNGQTYLANGGDELISAFRRVFVADRIQPNDPWVTGSAGARLAELFRAAVSYYEANDQRGARVTLEGAAREQPNSATARYNLSLAFEAEGQIGRAIEQAEAYLQLRPDAPDRAEVQERIGQLRGILAERPSAAFDAGQCAELLEWGAAEGARVRDPDQRALAFRIMNSAQRGECDTANQLLDVYRTTYGR